MAKNTTALERARQRALGGDTPARPVQPKTVARQRITIQARGREYPALDPGYYELSPDQQGAYLDSLDALEDKKKGETLFDRTALAVMDIAQAQGKKITKLERLVESLVGEVRELRQELSQRDQALEIQRADSLVEAESQLAQTIVNAAAVEASLRNQTKESEVVHERQRLETQAQLESLAAPITTLEGRVKSSTTLMGERSNAVLDQLASIEGRLSKTEVSQTEIDDGIRRNRTTLETFTGYDLESAIDSSVKRSFDNQLEGAMEGLIERKYVTTAPLTGLDGYDPKVDSSAKPFLAKQEGDDPTARAVSRALKKGRA